VYEPEACIHRRRPTVPPEDKNICFPWGFFLSFLAPKKNPPRPGGRALDPTRSARNTLQSSFRHAVIRDAYSKIRDDNRVVVWASG